MKLTIQSQEERPLMHRTDYTVRVEMGGSTPTRVVLVQALSKELNVDAKLVVVRQINPVFGETTSVVQASVYKKTDALEQYESSYMTKRHAPKEKSAEKTPEKSESSEEKPAEAPKKEAPEEKPKEEAPEKKPVEEKVEETPTKEPEKKEAEE